MPAGRPRKEIKKDSFEKLCGLQCTETEICGFFGVTDKTLSRWCRENYDGRNFSETFKELSQDGKISLRRAQFRLAEKSSAMAIWLGKQYLGQHDVQEFTISPEATDDTIRRMNEYFKGTGVKPDKV